MIRVAICDDMENEREKMSEYVRMSGKKLGMADELEIMSYCSGEDIVKDISEKKNEYDIIIMDVQLGGIDGKEALKILRRNGDNAVVCIVSANEHIEDSDLRLSPTRYIMKNDSVEDIEADVECLLKTAIKRQRAEYLFFTVGNESVRIQLKDILYVSKIKRGSEVHIKECDRIITVRENLKEIEEPLLMSGFGYAHNSYMINYGAVAGFIENNKAVRLDNGEMLNISRSYKDTFIKGLIGQRNMQ